METHDDHFVQGTEDVAWLPVVAAKNWIILTKDESIGRTPLEIEALRNANARVFVLASNKLNGSQIGKAFVKNLPAMRKFIQDHRAPFIAKVYYSVKVRAWKPPW